MEKQMRNNIITVFIVIVLQPYCNPHKKNKKYAPCTQLIPHQWELYITNHHIHGIESQKENFESVGMLEI